jgi:hypothetical protein
MAEKKDEKKAAKSGTAKAATSEASKSKITKANATTTEAAISKAEQAGTSSAGDKDKVNKDVATSPETDTTKEGEEKESYLKDLMAISGYGGLYRFVSEGRNGIIVESIETGKRMQAFATMKVSALKDITVYTEEEEVQLEEVIAAIHKYENGQEAISPKSDPDDLKDYFSAILPEYDRSRVYVSDIKKILSWYNLMLKYNLIKLEKPDKKAATGKES